MTTEISPELRIKIARKARSDAFHKYNSAMKIVEESIQEGKEAVAEIHAAEARAKELNQGDEGVAP